MVRTRLDETWPDDEGVVHAISAVYAEFDAPNQDEDLTGYLLVTECERRVHVEVHEYEDTVKLGSRRPTCVLCVAEAS